MNFDEIIDRRGTHCSKWDSMEPIFGVSPDDGLAMWVADMDFRPPAPVTQALRDMVDHGIFGYFGDDRAYLSSICWWMQTRHNWSIEPEAILTTNGLVNAVGLCTEAFTAPGDGVVLFSPVYHAFYRVLKAAGREVVDCPLVINEDGCYGFDFAAYDAQMTGREKMLILCSPHNPGGRVWSAEELRGVADFARRHDLILVSDEIHQDIVMPGHTHLPMAVADPAVTDRLVMLNATTKSFNIAGAHIGNAIIPDPELRRRFATRAAALGTSPNAFGQVMVPAAYSPEGAEWIDALCRYLDENRKLFDDGIAAIPGLRSMPLQGTYLAWVDASGTGMDTPELMRRTLKEARIAALDGAAFGTGGARFLRFNFATPRARVQEAVSRLQAAFADLQ